MQFPQLYRFKQEYPELADQLTRVEEHLNQVLARPPADPQKFWRAPQHDIDPERVAFLLDTHRSRAIALLYLFDKAGILIPRLDIYCPVTELFIDSFPSRGALPDNLDCPHHERDTQHSFEEYEVKLMFEFSRQTVKSKFAAAAG